MQEATSECTSEEEKKIPPKWKNPNDQHSNIFGQWNQIGRLHKLFIMTALRNDKYSLNPIGVWQRNVIDRIHATEGIIWPFISSSFFFGWIFSHFFHDGSRINRNLFIINASNVYATWWNERNYKITRKIAIQVDGRRWKSEKKAEKMPRIKKMHCKQNRIDLNWNEWKECRKCLFLCVRVCVIEFISIITQ